MVHSSREIKQADFATGGSLNVVCVSVGNTNTKFGLFSGRELLDSGAMSNEAVKEIAGVVVAMAETEGNGEPRATVVMASVNAVVAKSITDEIERLSGRSVYRIGVDLPIPLHGRLDHEAMTGHDRALNALAAYEIMKQAVVVVDAGTAITVDFVDGEGVFHGGAIAPGVSTALRAMHHFTEALPELKFSRPAEHAFGANTQQAMLNGAFYGARGLVRALVERYAEAYGGYPLVIATGGDAETLFGDDEMVDRVVPHLTLLGIAISCERALEAEP